MANPPSSEAFFIDPKPALSQGDITLSPSIVLWSDGHHALEFGRVPSAPEMGDSVVAAVWDTYNREDIPLVVGETRWSPVMVLSHDCELEKEFNRRAGVLIREGLPQEEAIRIASEDPNLDRFVLVAPLLPYGDLPDDQHAGVLRFKLFRVLHNA